MQTGFLLTHLPIYRVPSLYPGSVTTGAWSSVHMFLAARFRMTGAVLLYTFWNSIFRGLKLRFVWTTHHIFTWLDSWYCLGKQTNTQKYLIGKVQRLFVLQKMVRTVKCRNYWDYYVVRVRIKFSGQCSRL